MNFYLKTTYYINKQYGFRTNHSTYMAVIDFIKDVSEAFDEGMNTIGIFMDLSKAFDTIDHDILLRDDFKTQPPVDRRFRPVSIVLNNGNRPEPDGTVGQPAVGF